MLIKLYNALNDSIKIHEFLTGLPTATVSQKHILLHQGETLSVICTVRGNPVPTIMWEHNGRALTMGRSRKFVKNNMKPSDSGNYECIAKNYVGIARVKVFVLVRGEKQLLYFVHVIKECTFRPKSQRIFIGGIIQGVAIKYTDKKI